MKTGTVVGTVEPFMPAGANPFHYDLTSMGTIIGTNVVVMYLRHDDQRQDAIQIVNVETGERVQISFPPTKRYAESPDRLHYEAPPLEND